MPGQDRMTLTVTAARCEARDVRWLELRDPQGADLPAFAAGAHLECDLPGGLVRHYSLCNDPRERHRYCVGVGRAADSRGGSSWMHDSLRVGATLPVSPPRNHFPLDPAAPEQVFIAGGIGITPIMAMVRACQATGTPWRLFYCARSRQRLAFYEELCAIDRSRCHFHLDDEAGGRVFDVRKALAAAGDAAHLYTCGPTPLMQAVEAATAGCAPERVHFEWFTASAAAIAEESAFTVVLRQSGTRYEVPPGKSILEVLEDHDAGVPYSCREGLCATCRTTVLAGEVDHRDKVLTAAERAGNKEMMICVSRSRSAVLELDL